ncbi:lipopolysaccharide biosynthesis protein [Alteromonas gracilis]
MVLAVIGIAEILRDLGLSAAAVRAPDLSRGQQSNLWWINTGLGAGLSTLTALSAPLIAAGFGHPELAGITLALAPSFLLSGMATQYRVDLTRRMRFSRIASIDLACAVAPLVVGVGAAVAGAGYWSLVIQQMVSGVLALALLAQAAGWAPSRYDRAAPVAPIVRLGLHFLFGSVMAYVSKNADAVVVGKVFGAAPLGLYSRSVQLVRTPLLQLQAPFGSVILPILAAAYDNDDRLMRAARRASIALVYPVIAIVGMVVAAPSALVAVTLGEQWLPAAPLVALVAVAGGLAVAATPPIWIAQARGLGPAMSIFNGIATAMSLILLILAASTGRLEAVAAAMALTNLLGWPLGAWMFSRASGLPLHLLALPSLRAVGVTTAAVLTAVAVRLRIEEEVGPLLVLAACAGTGALVLSASVVVPAVRRDLREITGMLSELRKTDAVREPAAHPPEQP